MKNGFELWENNGGGITLYIFSNGEAVEAVTGLESLTCYKMGSETMRNMIGQLAADPDAYKQWDGLWSDGEDSTPVSQLYDEEAFPERNHDLSVEIISGEYDERWNLTVTVNASSNMACSLLGWE